MRPPQRMERMNAIRQKIGEAVARGTEMNILVWA